MVTLEQLKEDLRIDFDDDNAILQRNIDAAVAIVEKYTSLVMVARSEQRIASVGKKFKVFMSPVLSVDGGTFEEFDDYTLITPNATTVTINYGSVSLPNLDKAVLRIAADLYENVEISSVALPIDVQLMLNQYRNDSFLS